MTDIELLRPRVITAIAPLPDQALIGDLWVGLQETKAALIAAQLALAQGTGDPAALLALQDQVRALTLQRDTLQRDLDAAKLAMTTEQGQFAAVKAADEAEIVRLNGIVTNDQVVRANLTKQLADAAAVHATDQTTIASQSLQLANQTQQLSLMTTAKAQVDAALLTAQQGLTAANAKITAQAQTITDQAKLIVDLQAQIAKLTPTNRAPVWDPAMPSTFTFQFGTPSTIDLGKYVSDPDGDPLTELLQTTGLPPGVTSSIDPATRHLILSYDGKGSVNAITRGNVIIADDGRP